MLKLKFNVVILFTHFQGRRIESSREDADKFCRPILFEDIKKTKLVSTSLFVSQILLNMTERIGEDQLH